MDDEKKRGPKGVYGPKDRAKAVAVAGMIMAGATQEEAATVAGVTSRSVVKWVHAWWWPEVQQEALKSVIFDQLRVKALYAVMKALEEGDGSLGLKILERIHPELFLPGQPDPSGIVIKVIKDE